MITGILGPAVDRVTVDDISGEFDVVILGWVRYEGYQARPQWTYGKLSDFSVVHTENLRLLAGAETKTGDEVHEEENDASSTE